MILDLLTITGLTLIITRGLIFKSIRERVSLKSDFFGKLFSCPMGMSVWVGLIFYFIPESVKSASYYPFIGSLLSYVVYLIIERLKLR